MTLIERQTRDKARFWENKAYKMRSSGAFVIPAYQIVLSQVKRYKSLLVEVDEENERG